MKIFLNHKKAISSMLAVLLIFAGLSLTGCQTTGVITLQDDIFQVNVGDELSTDLSDYVKASKSMMEEMTLDVSSVDVNTIGKYKCSVTYENYNARFTIEVTDLVAPVIELNSNSFYLSIGAKLQLDDVVKSITDYSDYHYGFSNDLTLADDQKNMLGELYFSEKGYYKEEILAKDEYGNFSVEEFTVNVIEEGETVEDENAQEIVDVGIYMNQNEGVDLSDLNAYSTEGVYYGVGESVDATSNRPDLAYYTDKYGSFTADFIMKDCNYIWLTFNEIYEYGNTEKILDTLKEKNVPAVFFITKSYAENNPELVQRMIDEGHVLGNYTTDDVDVPGLSVNDLTTQIDSLYNFVDENYGYQMYLFRAPSGYFSEQSLAVAQGLGYRTVFWSFAYADWDVNNQPDKESALANAADRLHGGAIYLLSGASSTNAAMLGDLIDIAREDGYEFAVYQKN